MKTNYFNIRQISLFAILGILGLAVSSCSSYQNTSSYDNDGIYGSVPHDANGNPVYTYNDGNVQHYNNGNNSGQNMNYKAYFSDLEDDFPYVPVENDTVVQTETYNSYPGWGETTDNVNVNIYRGYGPMVMDMADMVMVVMAMADGDTLITAVTTADGDLATVMVAGA